MNCIAPAFCIVNQTAARLFAASEPQVGVPGVTVTFSDAGAGGSFSSASMVTNSNGKASTLFTTPPKMGAFNVTATAAGLAPVTFEITVD